MSEEKSLLAMYNLLSDGVGRPKILLSDLQPDWKQTLDYMGKQGCADVEMRAEIGPVCQTTWDRLIKEEEEFSIAVKGARIFSEQWWYGKGRELKGKEINTSLYALRMSSCYGMIHEKKINLDHTNDDKTDPAKTKRMAAQYMEEEGGEKDGE